MVHLTALQPISSYMDKRVHEPYYRRLRYGHEKPFTRFFLRTMWVRRGRPWKPDVDMLMLRIDAGGIRRKWHRDLEYGDEVRAITLTKNKVTVKSKKRKEKKNQKSKIKSQKVKSQESKVKSQKSNVKNQNRKSKTEIYNLF